MSATACAAARRAAPRSPRGSRELLALVGLPDAGPKYPAQLSGGQQQRVALARALATSPGLLLLDEPLSALDARVRVRLRHEIKALQRRLGVTTIMVTHDQEEALTMADRIVVMNHGVIEQVGTPTEIYRRPATPFVADFVGTMNFLDGVVAGAGPRARRRARARLRDRRRPRRPAPRCGSACGRKTCACATSGRDAEHASRRRSTGIEFLGSFWRASSTPTADGGRSIVADFSINAVRDLDRARPAAARRAAARPPARLRAPPEAWPDAAAALAATRQPRASARDDSSRALALASC